jgi:DNA-binding CsgD family transcriptional regulator
MYTQEDRAAAHRAVVAARIALRFEILLRDRAGYLATIGSDTAATEEEIALADLTLDPRCAAAALATPEEWSRFEAVCWQAVKVHLGLAKRLARSNLIKRFALDPDIAEGLVLDGLVQAIGTWDPSRGALGTHAGYRVYSLARSWARPAQLRDNESAHPPAYETVIADPLAMKRLETALLGLDLEERRVVATWVDEDDLKAIAAERGVQPHTISRQRTRLTQYLRSMISA